MAEGFVVRLLVVLAAVGAVAAVAAFRPRRPRTPLSVEGNLDGPGVYLFTAAGCDACDEARLVYSKVLGESGFIERSWEEHSDLLARVGVADLPSGAVVGADGRQVASFAQVPKPPALRWAVRKMRA
ncbi:MAG: hypothetical protein OXM57_11835 [bacterium]|nr:hypothetical protein [bacterium]MDE0353370.1 hypothetical protein [bacterium]